MSNLDSAVRALFKEALQEAIDDLRMMQPPSPKTNIQEIQEPLLLSPREAAKLLSISERHLFSLSSSGRIPSVRLGLLVRYSVKTLKEWIQATESTDEPMRKRKAQLSANSSEATKPLQPSRTGTMKRSPKAEKAQEVAVQPPILQRVQQSNKSNAIDEERISPLTPLLKDIGVSRDDIPPFTNGELQRIAGTDMVTMHGWLYLGKELPPAASERLCRHFSQYRRPERPDTLA